jgi:DNA-3-methyladenine glycosylase II
MMAQMNNFSQSLTVLKRDPRFAKLIKKHGLPDLERGKNPFQALCRSIIYQQVSGKAAASIFRKFVALFSENGKKFPTPEMVHAMPIEKLRTAGLSGQKASYIHDLAEKFTDGTIQHRSLDKMESDELIEHLTQVKGIGVWTAHMFLIFTLNRLDVLPTGDLGVRKGFQAVYKLRKLPDHKKMETLAKEWRAHASIGAWYLWRVADEGKAFKW